MPLILPGLRHGLLGHLENPAHGNSSSMTPWNDPARHEEMTQRAAWAALSGLVEAWVARLRNFEALMFFECLLPTYSDFDSDLNLGSFDSTAEPFRFF